jgi:hypothetical protein
MHQLFVEQLEGTLRQAQLDGDVEALDRLIDDALLFVGPDGALLSKEDDLALHLNGAVRFISHEPTDLQWRLIAPDVVAVSLRTRLGVLVHGQAVAGDYHYTRVWARREERWRVVAGHVSAVPMQNTA